MIDRYGRQIEDLRVSVTDKCNLRCVYCMPEQGLPWLKREAILTYEEIAAIVRAMAELGLRRIRLTGGEPLLRRDLASLVRLLVDVDGIEEVSLSTNAVLLAEQAETLREAGLMRINVSLDSLREERLDAIARRQGFFAQIMAGLEAAEVAGLDPIKINVVLLRGINDGEIEDFAAVTLERPWHVRFIELMPTGANLELSAERYFSCDEALDRVRSTGELEPVEGPTGSGPATYFRLPGARGTVGVISPMSHNFCHSCNRMRLTADGHLRPCLFGPAEVNLREPVRSRQDLAPVIAQALRMKPRRHELGHPRHDAAAGLVALSQTGG